MDPICTRCGHWPADSGDPATGSRLGRRSFEQEGDQAQLRIGIDRRQVARFGINVRDVQDVIELAIGGRPVSTLFEGERRFDIAVRFIPGAQPIPPRSAIS